MYHIIPNGEEVIYQEELESFTTQHGYEAVRFIGDEIPTYEDGFKAYDENDKYLFDLSRFKYEYQQNEYSVEEDEIEQPLPNNDISYAPNPLTGIYAKIDQINTEVKDITPYVETKTAYIDDTEIEFDIVKDGNILLSAVDSDGDSVEVLLKKEGKKAIAEFIKPLEKVTKVTMSIQ